MPGHLGDIWIGNQVPPPPLQVLGVASYGGTSGRVIRRTLLWIERRDTGGPTVAHHIQCGGGHGGPPLGIFGHGMSGEG